VRIKGRGSALTAEQVAEIDLLMIRRNDNPKSQWETGLKVMAYRYGVSDATIHRARLRRGTYAKYPAKIQFPLPQQNIEPAPGGEMMSEMQVYLRKLALHREDPRNNPRPRLPPKIRESLKKLGAKGGSAGTGDAKRRSPDHYKKMALARRKKKLGW
jgi:hypothetical protein